MTEQPKYRNQNWHECFAMWCQLPAAWQMENKKAAAEAFGKTVAEIEELIHARKKADSQSSFNPSSAEPQDARSQAAQALQEVDAWLVDGSAVQFSLEEAVLRLALLTELEYESSDRRKKACKRLGISKPNMLDRAVRDSRPKEVDEDTSPGSDITITDLEPWDSSVDGLQLFNDLTTLIRRFVFFQNPNEAYAVAVWCIFTHCYDEFSISPYLCAHAPATECGKTTLLKVILRLARRALPSVNLSSAVMFRVIEEDRPTLIIDELKKFLEASEEFLGILLSGHERDFAFVQRCVGDEQKRKNFSTWGPKAYGMIGMPPDLQLRNRSIVIHLTRKKADESVERWPIVNPPAEFFEPFARLHRQIVRWVKDNSDGIRASCPDVSNLKNRESDNWTPLLMIAAVLGSDALVKTKSAIGDSRLGIDGDEEARMVLRDIQNIFYTRKVERIPTQALVNDLIRQGESGWNRCHDGREMDHRYLARLLKAYDIKPKMRRYSKEEQALFQIVGKATRGYDIHQFKDAFGRFLGDDKPELVEVMGQQIDEREVEMAATVVTITKIS